MEDFTVLISVNKDFNPNYTKIPNKSYRGDAGYDLYYSGSNRMIAPQEILDLPTGWNIKVPDGYWGSIKSRSSTFAKRKLLVLEGVIDSGYTGPLSVLIFNPTSELVQIKSGDRLAQFMVIPVYQLKFEETEIFPDTKRGDSGFGSTGK